MFQGIIEQKGKVTQNHGNRIALRVQKPWRSKPGDSVAINGVCLTVVKQSAQSFIFDLGQETRSITNLAQLKAGDWLNLERPLRLGDPIHGHLVLGHVETKVRVLQSAPNLRLEIPRSKSTWVISKGCLAVDGVSLTINKVKKTKKGLQLDLCLIPETLKRTCLGHKKPGDWVNIETDYMAKIMSKEKRYAKRKN